MTSNIRYCVSFCIAGFLLALAGCSTNPRLTIEDTLSGFNRSELAALMDAAADAPVNLHSLIIARRGRIVAELYRDGWSTDLSAGGGVLSHWSKQGSDTVHDVRSVTKSIVALAAGAVLDRNPEYGVRAKIRDFPS